jgi:hypothetical protein
MLNEVCKIIAEIGGYGMVWVGYAEHDSKKTVQPVALCRLCREKIFNLKWHDF